MSSYSWKNHGNEVAMTSSQKVSMNTSDELRMNLMDIKQKDLKRNDKKRKKFKRNKEEKEDGELDEDNDDIISQDNYDDYEDYDEYDYEDESPKSRENTSKKLESVNISSEKNLTKKATVNELTEINDSIEIKSANKSNLQNYSDEIKLTAQSENKNIKANLSQTASLPQPSFSITNPYDIEYEDYDTDDDDFGNNKRLKIDESEDVSNDKVSNLSIEIENELVKNNVTVLNTIANNNLMKQDSISNQDKDEIKSINNQNIEPTPKSVTDEFKTKESGSNGEASDKQSGIDNDNEASVSSVISSKSTSSELTAISSDSLPISTISISSCQKLEKFTSQSVNNINSEEDVDFKSKSVSSPLIEKKKKDSKTTFSKVIDLKSELSISGDDALKVPSLKIIFSNSNGGHPYVKVPPTSDLNSSTDMKNAKTNNKIDSSQNMLTPSKQMQQIDCSFSNIGDSPVSSSRTKTSRSTRVASPVTTSYKSTPTRRSAAAAAAAALATAGRSSPSTTNNNKEQKSSTLSTNETSGYYSSLNSSSNSTTTPSNQTSGFNETDSPGTRRKLRSHTRLGVDDFPAIGRIQNSAIKSPSPLTIQNENTNFNIDSDGTANSAPIEPKLNQITETSEHSNGSLVDSDSTLANSLNLSDFLPTRKRRNRHQQQQLQEQLDLINEIDTLNALAESAYQFQSESDQKIDGIPENDGFRQENDEVDSSKDVNVNQPALFSCIKKFVDLRNNVLKRREELKKTKLDIKLPRNFKDFFLFRKNYLTKNNKEAQKLIPYFKPPTDLPEDLKSYFSKQEKERYSLRLRHRVEQDKLNILYEQEILRSFNKSARDAVNQTVPFSFCSMIKDDEIYSVFRISDTLNYSVTSAPTKMNLSELNINTSINIENRVKPEVENNDTNLQCEEPSTQDLFLQKLSELRNKFQKLKDDCIKRQLNESDSLHAVQKMDFQSKIRELSNKYKNAVTNGTASINSNPNSPLSVTNLTAVSLNAYNIVSNFQQNDLHVPIVHVNNKFELLDATHHQFISNESASPLI